MKIIRWERHGDLHVGVDDRGWKRAVIMSEDFQHYGYAPLGAVVPVREFRERNLRRLRHRIVNMLEELP